MPWIVNATCEFDGKLSLVHHRGEYLLYARANLAARGQRFVQFARSTNLRRWSEFRLIDVDGYNASDGNIYFFAAQANPVLPGTLLALVPLVSHLRGCVAITFSRCARRSRG